MTEPYPQRFCINGMPWKIGSFTGSPSDFNMIHMLFAICASSLERCTFRYFTHTFNWVLLLFLCLFFDLLSVLSMFGYNFFIDVCFVNVFSQSVACCFFFLNSIFRNTEVFNFNKFKLLI